MVVAVVPHSIVMFEETPLTAFRWAVISLESYFLKMFMIPKIIIASNVSIANFSMRNDRYWHQQSFLIDLLRLKKHRLIISLSVFSFKGLDIYRICGILKKSKDDLLGLVAVVPNLNL